MGFKKDLLTLAPASVLSLFFVKTAKDPIIIRFLSE